MKIGGNKFQILGYEVEESELRSSILYVLEKRGLSARLTIEEELTLPIQRTDYANVHNWGFKVVVAPEVDESDTVKHI